MRRKRVGVDMHSVGGIHQGIRTHLLELYAQAIVLAPDIDFIFCGVKRETLVAFHGNYGSLNVECVPMRPTNSAVRLLWQLPRLERQHAFDLLHVQYVMPLFNKAKVAVTIHDILFESYAAYFTLFFRLRSAVLMRYASRFADIVFTVSKFSKAEIADRYHKAAEHIFVTPNAADNMRFHPGNDEEAVLAKWGLVAGNYLLGVGRLEPRKNYPVLLRAYAQLQDPPPLVIVGQADFRFNDIFTLVSELGLKDTVRILSDVTTYELPALFRHSFAFVYASVAEGFGMPVMEAFASGTPVICCDSTALSEIARDAALLITPDSVSSLADGLSKLLLNPELRVEMMRAGLERSKQYTWQHSAEVLVEQLRLSLTPQTLS